MTLSTNSEQLRLAEEVMLRAWRRHREARELYEAMLKGPDARVDPTGSLDLVELALFVRRTAFDLREAIRSHEEAAQDERATREQLARTLPPGAG